MVPDGAAALVGGRRGAGPTEWLTRGFVVAMAVATVATAGKVRAWPWLLASDALSLVLVELIARGRPVNRFGWKAWEAYSDSRAVSITARV